MPIPAIAGALISGAAAGAVGKLLGGGGKIKASPAFQPMVPLGQEYGNFLLTEDAPQLTFWGNFYNLSHVFSIDTIDPDVINRLTAAIRANQQTAAYQQARRERMIA